jgi:hypothetical protein
MEPQSLTFGDLAHRLAPPPPACVRCCAPLIASISPHCGVSMPGRDLSTQFPAARNPGQKRTWAILHSISDWHVRLIHPRPLKNLQFDVEVKSPGGEVLRFVLAVGKSTKVGELYETSAEVVHSGWGSFPYPIAS